LQTAAVEALARIPDDHVSEELISRFRGYSPALRTQVLDLLMSRQKWQRALLQAIDEGRLPASELDAARRHRLSEHRDSDLRDLARRVLGDGASSNRRQVLEEHADVATMRGNTASGQQVFAKRCAACHRLGDSGHNVGPNLNSMLQKTPQFLLSEMLDPNRNVDSRYVQYTAVTTDGRVITGILAAESGASITLKGQENKQEMLLRGELEELASSGKSIMPEGLEKDLSKQEMADVIAYVLDAASGEPSAATAQVPTAETTTKTPAAAIAAQLLDDKLPRDQRQKLAEEHSAQAAELVAAMTADLPVTLEEEYRRIPWIWRVSVAAGKQNQTDVLRKLLEVSLPKVDQPLADWQAVVIGGGIVNGASIAGAWPRPRIAELIGDDAGLEARWRRLLPLAAAMADNAKTRPGTRYDALRIISLDDWQTCRPQLLKYLPQTDERDLQMGAVSGLSDIDRPEIAALLLAHVPQYSPGNRKLAIDALLRTANRARALIEALERGEVSLDQLSEDQVRAIRSLDDSALRERAKKLLEKRNS
jgi:putative heme-binding domain-containing protein